MKHRLSAILLAAGLTVSAFSMGVSAEETETEAGQQATEAVTEAADLEEEEVQEALSEAESELESQEQAAQSEASGTETESETESESMSEEEYYVSIAESYLQTLSDMDDASLAAMEESDDAGSALVAFNWAAAQGELGDFEEVTSVEVSMEGQNLILLAHAKYEEVADTTDVEVTFTFTVQSTSMALSNIEWNVEYPLSTLIQRAGLNTVMGLAIVFAALAFLTFVIGKLHFISDFVEGKGKKEIKEEQPAQAAAVPVQAVPEPEEEDLTDDLELVAVIAAAIAASENRSPEGFVVRSIRKANKRNWRNA